MVENDGDVEKALLPKNIPKIVITNIKQVSKESNSSLGNGNITVSTQTDPLESHVLEDDINSAIGDFGKWQFRLTLVLSLLNIPCTWHIFAFTFQGGDQEFWCASPNVTVDYWKNLSCPCSYINQNYSQIPPETCKSLSITQPCSEWSYNTTIFGQTIIKEWNLVCSNASLKSLAEMVFLLGVAIGGFFSGLVSDKFGRKKALMGSLLFQLVLGILIAIAPFFELYLVLRAFLGFFCVSIVFSGFVLSMELVGGRWLTIVGVLYLLPVPLGYITISLIAYYSRDWRILQWIITIPTIFFMALWRFIPESPRWKISMGRVKEAVLILEAAAKVNNRKLPPNLETSLKMSALKSNKEVGRKVEVLDLWRTPLIRLISFVQYIIWFAVYLVYYGLQLKLSNLGGDVYMNTVISGLVEFPALFISIFFLLKMGRRRPLCLTTLGAGLACLVASFTSGSEAITLAMFGKFAISCSNAIMPIYTAELFPTRMRNLGVGASSVPAGIALILIPYLFEIQPIISYFPMGSLGVVGIVGGISVLLLPDTTGLADSVFQLETPSNTPLNSLKKKVVPLVKKESREVTSNVPSEV